PPIVECTARCIQDRFAGYVCRSVLARALTGYLPPRRENWPPPPPQMVLRRGPLGVFPLHSSLPLPLWVRSPRVARRERGWRRRRLLRRRSPSPQPLPHQGGGAKACTSPLVGEVDARSAAGEG